MDRQRQLALIENEQQIAELMNMSMICNELTQSGTISNDERWGILRATDIRSQVRTFLDLLLARTTDAFPTLVDALKRRGNDKHLRLADLLERSGSGLALGTRAKTEREMYAVKPKVRKLKVENEIIQSKIAEGKDVKRLEKKYQQLLALLTEEITKTESRAQRLATFDLKIVSFDRILYRANKTMVDKSVILMKLIEDINTDVKTLRTDSVDQNTSDQAEAAMQQKSDEAEEILRQLDVQEKRIQSLEEDIRQLTATRDHTALKDKLETAEKELLDERTKIRELKIKYQMLKNELDEGQETTKQLQENFQQLQTEIDEERSSRLSHAVENLKLQTQVQEEKTKLTALKEAHRGLESELKAKATELAAQNEQLQQELNTEKQIIENLEVDRQRLQKQLDEEKEKTSSQEQQIETLEKRVGSLEKTLADSNARNEELLSKLLSAFQEMKEQAGKKAASVRTSFKRKKHPGSSKIKPKYRFQ